MLIYQITILNKEDDPSSLVHTKNIETGLTDIIKVSNQELGKLLDAHGERSIFVQSSLPIEQVCALACQCKYNIWLDKTDPQKSIWIVESEMNAFTDTLLQKIIDHNVQGEIKKHLS